MALTQVRGYGPFDKWAMAQRSLPAGKDKDRGTEPEIHKQEQSWFWCADEPGTDLLGGKEFVGSRWNNVHLTLARNRGSHG